MTYGKSAPRLLQVIEYQRLTKAKKKTKKDLPKPPRCTIFASMFKTKADLQQAVKNTKGKFFSLAFTKKDGSERVACCKEKYESAIRGGSNHLENTPYVSIFDVNKGGWISVHPENVKEFSHR